MRSKDAQNSLGEFHHVRSVTCFNLVFRSLAEIEKWSQAILEKRTVVVRSDLVSV